MFDALCKFPETSPEALRDWDRELGGEVWLSTLSNEDDEGPAFSVTLLLM